jgi:hypothetical protein
MQRLLSAEPIHAMLLGLVDVNVHVEQHLYGFAGSRCLQENICSGQPIVVVEN